MLKNNSDLKLTFFGSSLFSVFCLEELKKADLLPDLIITTADKKSGRGLKLVSTPVKAWAEKNKITCLSPLKLDASFIKELRDQMGVKNIFLVASYGKIIPKGVLTLPEHGVLNIHPSLLPKYRGPSPLQEQILNNEEKKGVTLMLVDEGVDHGPIIAQTAVNVPNWPVKFEELEAITAQTGTKMFVENLEAWLEGKIKAVPQNHDQATFTKKIEKENGVVDLNTDDPQKTYLKFLAYHDWPHVYFFAKKKDRKIRVTIKEAELQAGVFTIIRVLPEGKREMSYEDFVRGL